MARLDPATLRLERRFHAISMSDTSMSDSTTSAFGALRHDPRVLLGPGPSNLHPRVAQAMTSPVLGYLDPEFLVVMDETMELLRGLFQTRNELTLALPGTGMAAMEAAIANVVEPGDEVVVGIHGYFGQRMAEIVERHGGQAVRVEVELGSVIDPDLIRAALDAHPRAKMVGVVHGETSSGIGQPLADIGRLVRERDKLFLVDTVCSLGGADVPVDALHVDICYSAGQKCIGGPAGISCITLSERAWQVVQGRRRPPDTWYLDLALIRKYWTAERVYHHTAPGPMVYALREALRIIHEEGLAARVARHQRCGDLLKRGLADLGLEVFGDPAHRLPMLTCVRIPAGVDDATVRRRLLEDHRIEIAGGFGPLKGKGWRIGLMGWSAREANVHHLLAALREILD
ncbi:MAG TPA: alanine--glyoxylate aminotransferase family protein [Longimicrobiales bacterium]|nr:alanine--glyoxylate aminotransferase family protein [Longimicrobiales bacterium]